MILAALGAWRFRRERLTTLLVLSVIALYALQPEHSGLAVALPAATLLLVVGAWWLVTPSRTAADLRILLLIGLVAGGASLVVAGVIAGKVILTVLPPLGLAVVGAVSVSTLVPADDEITRRRLALAYLILIVILFVVLKTPALQAASAGAFAQVGGGSVLPDWGWLGFSYIAFRLMHVLLDYRIGRLGAISLRDFALYVIFFPALSAGPIARVEQFSRELAGDKKLDSAALLEGGRRIGIGLFKKFVLADLLAYLALSPQLAAQTDNTAALWVMLYAYAFRLFFDFSGYVDIAIGIGRLAGITLPENFTAPYTKRNITAFWNSWHITLATWFRTYFFTPLSRVLMGTPLRSRRLLVILIVQVCTMVLIGLWHGVALNFVLWGAWHGLGLWLHKVQQDRSRRWDAYMAEHPTLARLIHGLSLVFTFHFVAVGWVFFALPSLSLIGKALAGLVGLHG
jgi:D-alanyl-lipoteichoic acid acyltransferase DltB (MBOAT superfamily)